MFTGFMYDGDLRILRCFVEGEHYLIDISCQLIEAILIMDALYYQVYGGLKSKIIVQYIDGYSRKLLTQKSFQHYKKDCSVEFRRWTMLFFLDFGT
ncbi:hypothetical protein AEA09_05050 [Lysinibacillus contaminans]|uniref:Homing endonuclease LAGLIDADG domain-containing protein n=1 Tax=Lysinibacillus contaminans TaxID=1293441 RepID=A0ABR5JZA2_9BACI|nr:hypothetical protein AEA09_05050 [Lysinibacillus contaminans]